MPQTQQAQTPETLVMLATTGPIAISGNCKLDIAPGGIYLTSMQRGIQTPTDTKMDPMGDASPLPISITKPGCIASINFEYAALSRDVFPTLVFIKTLTLDKKPVVIEKVTLTNARFCQYSTSISSSNNSGGPNTYSESLQITFEKIEIQNFIPNQAGNGVANGTDITLVMGGGMTPATGA